MKVNEIIDKYSPDMMKRLKKDNVKKITRFLINQHCDYCKELLEDYLDLFAIDYEEFKTKYNMLNLKYNNKFLDYANQDMNLFEEFYD